MQVQDYMIGIKEVFEPVSFYEGSYLIPIEVLENISLHENKKNKIKEFFEKNYLKKIKGNYRNLNLLDDIPLTLISTAENNERVLKVSTSSFVSIMLENILNEKHEIKEKLTNQELKERTLEIVSTYRKKLNDVLENKTKSKYYMEILNTYSIEAAIIRKELRNKNINIPLDTFINRKKDQITSFLINLKKSLEDLSKPIDLDELEKCLDLESFYLTMAKLLVELSKLVEQETGRIHNSFCFVDKYAATIRKIRKTSRYNIRVKSYTNNKRERNNYDVDKLLKEYADMRLRHPEYEIKVVTVTLEEIKEKKENGTLQEYLDQMSQLETLKASWDFVRKGSLTKEEKEQRNKTNNLINKYYNKETDIQELIERKNFLDSSNYLYKLMGKNNFQGYIGYLYQNGIVLFEKFYENIEELKPALSHATYVMNLENFVEVSKKTKKEIIKHIKQGASDVKRIYHTTTWNDRIIKTIKKKEYNKEIINEIDILIKNNELEKKKVYE